MVQEASAAARAPRAALRDVGDRVIGEGDGDVFTAQRRPLGAGHHLEVSLKPRVPFRAVDHRAGGCLVAHLLQRRRRARSAQQPRLTTLPPCGLDN